VALCYAVFLATMAAIGLWKAYGPFYHSGLLFAGVIAGYHVAWIRGRSREGCFRAFRHNHWIGLAVFAGVVLDNLPGGAGAG
jgi:4-hydroxybenzoate polyprenyltransferase